MSSDRQPFDETFLKEKLKSDPTSWETRRQLAHGLYVKQSYEEAAEMVWSTEEIPGTDLDLAFAIHILAKAQPRRAIRLLTAVLELHQGKAVRNIEMANALLQYGMVLQAARFYGAALEADPTLVNPDLEHFMLWSDDECTMWGLFENNRPKLGQLPWMLRDPEEARGLTSYASLHTTPIYVPGISVAAGEELEHDLYQQESFYNAKITPPPAITVPAEKTEPKEEPFQTDYETPFISSEEAPAAAPVTDEEPVAPVDLPTPVVPPAPSNFPASVVFPESAPRVIPAAPALPVFTPMPAAEPAAVVTPVETPITPSVLPVFTAPPEPIVKSSTATVPFFADPIPSDEAPLAAAAPNYVDSMPSAVTPLPVAEPFFVEPTPPAANPATSTVPFFVEPTPPPVVAPLHAVIPAFTEPPAPVAAIPFFVEPPAPAAIPLTATAPVLEKPNPVAAPLPQIITEDTVLNAPKAAEEEASANDPFRISQSSLPTTVLRVKWGAPPARPGGSAAPPASPPPTPPPSPPVFQASGSNQSEVTQEGSAGNSGLPFMAAGPLTEAPIRPPIPSSAPPPPKPPASLIRRLFSSGSPSTDDDQK